MRNILALALALSTTLGALALTAGSASAGDETAPTYTETKTDDCTTTK